MKIVKVSAIPMSAPVPEEKRHRTDLGTKVKSDATLIRVETDNGLTGIGAALGTPPIVAAIVEHELAAECVGEDPLFSERIYEKMYNGSRSRPALERGITQADESRRRGVIMEAIAGVDIAVWDVKARALAFRSIRRLAPRAARCAAMRAAAGRRARRPKRNSRATPRRASPLPRCVWWVATASRSGWNASTNATTSRVCCAQEHDGVGVRSSLHSTVFENLAR
jgi:L-alanine-DL-glutamate epimerase-like enolase superfamily enzyme